MNLASPVKMITLQIVTAMTMCYQKREVLEKENDSLINGKRTREKDDVTLAENISQQ